MMLKQCLEMVKGRVEGVLHVGAHTGQEAPIYKELGIERVVWVEANPELLDELRANVAPQEVIHATVWGTSQQMTFNISSNSGHSSSLLKAGTVKKCYPDIVWDERQIKVTTTTIDKLSKAHDLSRINALVMDIQGAEAEALQGAWRFLRQIDFVYTEINFDSVYHGCPDPSYLESFLPGFTCSALADTTNGWGDAFYHRYRWSVLDFKTRHWALLPTECNE